MKPTDRDPVAGLAALPGLGQTSAQMLIEVGVTDPDALIRLGPLECFRRLRFQHGKRVTVNFVYALECASRGLHWRELDHERKTDLRLGARKIIEELARKEGD